MKVLFTYILLLTLTVLQGQNCDYTIPKYGFKATKNIYLGSDKDYRLLDDSLFVDIYYPVGSPEVKRPLVMWVFGGGFFQGKRQDFDLLCQEFAKRGFVAATIDYRIGFEGAGPGLNPPFAFDAAEIVRAGYRGMQDGKAALRFLKSNHERDSIDLERVWVAGASAGSFVAMGTVFLTTEDQKPAQVGKITPANGRNRDDLGPVEGNRYVNGYDAKVQGVFNIFGGLLDTNLIRPDNKIAVMSYHQDMDPVVPCGANMPYYPIPFISANYPIAYGSCMIDSRLRNIGMSPNLFETWIYSGNQHATHDEAAVVNYMLTNANPILCGTVSATTNSKLSTIKVYPNPVEHHLSVSGIENQTHYKILTMSGNIVEHNKINSNQKISVETLIPGIYIIQFNENGFQKSIRFVKI
ncbi:MAG: carboxylesterase family protein [Saprospiraceae bacterium]|uniref:Carboxylesterase family protein n=1 Tax=Candidatus Defluviibacterium haderslevense TaxID=2981993 RepID=A0A9D7SAU1_9BACT|nr:carboxylesterase family protein [Candidatus Defluviibacterium haderslevense]